MSLLDLIAAAGEELIGLRALGAGKDPERHRAANRRISRLSLQAALFSLLLLAICWPVARLFPEPRTAGLAAVGVYVGLAGALLSALSWAYARLTLGQAASRRQRDA